MSVFTSRNTDEVHRYCDKKSYVAEKESVHIRVALADELNAAS